MIKDLYDVLFNEAVPVQDPKTFNRLDVFTAISISLFSQSAKGI